MFLLILSCQSNNIYESQFDGPKNAYVLENSQYYRNPIAFVTNQFSSKISPIDLKFEIPLINLSLGYQLFSSTVQLDCQPTNLHFDVVTNLTCRLGSPNPLGLECKGQIHEL